VLVDELARCGVREAVLAPGSRSAPLAFALHAADAEARIRLHVRVDERSAGFLALGLAKSSGLPVPVVTTSGTATANVHPAVLEASEAGVPLLVLTADRPPELRATGANQTVDQVKLYGDAVRFFAEVGTPGQVPGQVAYWRALACRAHAAASGLASRDPGPVHLNLAFRDPLVPEAVPDSLTDAVTEDGRDGDETWVEPLDGRPHAAPWTSVEPAPQPRPERLPPVPRTLLLVGDCPPAVGRAAGELAERAGWPLLSEPSGNARASGVAVTTYALLLGVPGFVDAHRPDRVVVVGRPTLGRAVRALLARPDVEVVTVSAGPRWPDPTRSSARVVPALPVPYEGDPTYLQVWTRAEKAAREALDTLLDGVSDFLPDPPPEPLVAREVLAGVPEGGLLVAGSSQPIRDLDRAAAHDGVTVLANRGAAGIDGTVSTAIGAALDHERAGGGPAYALLGDLTLLHDAAGLVLGPDEPRPHLTLVVVNNDGGGIFGMLEPGEPAYAPAFERVFGTPHGADLGALAAAADIPYARADTLDDLRRALAPVGGIRLVEVRTDRATARELAVRLQEAVADAVR
ncbi:MAG: 2-succinyl-5-enolpyruvyl-6-hydroxy-3-cyclohexene-1-carboxylic-acid synthase, partial [Actinomycetes bacterium]